VIFGIVLAVGGGLSIALTIKGGAYVQGVFGTSAAGYVAGLLGFVSFLAIVIAAFFGGDAISTDFGTKTGYFMLAMPVRRSVLLSGRYAAALATSIIALLVFYGFALYGGIAFYSFGSVPWGYLGLSFALSVLLVAGVLSFAFCLSATSKSPAIGLVVTIVVLLVAFSIVDGVVGRLAGQDYLFFSILYAANVISQVVVSGFNTFVVGGVLGGGTPALWEGIAIMASYAVLFFGLAHVLYSREET
jgi:ABC-type transport system involved in multi-copper enzyme maturation permease subunit